MSSPRTQPPRTPVADRAAGVHRFTGRLNEALDGLDSTRVWAMSADEVGEALREVYAAEAKLAVVKSALIRQGEAVDLPARDASVSMTAWLRDQVRIAPAEVKKQIRLAHGLETRPVIAEALGRGEFPPASAQVIVKAVDALPAEADPWVADLAVKHLTSEAHVHDTAALRVIAARLDEVVDPDGADARLAVQLARAEEAAARETYARLSHDEASQTTDGVFRIPLIQGVRLDRMLQALLNPARPDPIERQHPTGARRSGDELRGHALTELIDRIPKTNLPQAGGCEPTVVVTMGLDILEGRLKAASLDTGHRIPPGLARRLAAQHGLIPAVLGGRSEVLDLGRKARLFSTKQRLAMAVQQDHTCAVEDCDRPISWGQAAHLTAWASGGTTDLTNGVIPCTRHHHLADHPDYQVTVLRPGRIRINRRT